MIGPGTVGQWIYPVIGPVTVGPWIYPVIGPGTVRPWIYLVIGPVTVGPEIYPVVGPGSERPCIGQGIFGNKTIRLGNKWSSDCWWGGGNIGNPLFPPPSHSSSPSGLHLHPFSFLVITSSPADPTFNSSPLVPLQTRKLRVSISSYIPLVIIHFIT